MTAAEFSTRPKGRCHRHKEERWWERHRERERAREGEWKGARYASVISLKSLWAINKARCGLLATDSDSAPAVASASASARTSAFASLHRYKCAHVCLPVCRSVCCSSTRAALSLSRSCVTHRKSTTWMMRPNVCYRWRFQSVSLSVVAFNYIYFLFCFFFANIKIYMHIHIQIYIYSCRLYFLVIEKTFLLQFISGKRKVVFAFRILLFFLCFLSISINLQKEN